MKASVAIVKCETYEPAQVYQAVKRGLDLLGGASCFIKPGENILLKPNLLQAVSPKKCVTTHPAVFRAVASLFKEAGAALSFGDSPAVGSPERAARKAGLMAVAEELGIAPADFKNGEQVHLMQALQNRQFVIARGALECDGIVSLPKLKTHALEKFTGAVKNQFGCVPGLLKGEFHVKLPDASRFGKMLVDLNHFLKPRLYVMDGVWAMEGNGPSGGDPVKMNVILLSSDPIALDATVCRLIDLNPAFVPTIRYGMEAGSGTYLAEEITLLGDQFSEFFRNSFAVKRRPPQDYRPDKTTMRNLLTNRMVPKPVIIKEKCTACGTCVNSCPVEPKALGWYQGSKDLPPVYNYNNCIRCYCCQEVCPEGAIELKKPVLRRLIPTA